MWTVVSTIQQIPHTRQFANRTRLIRTPSVPVQPQINRIPFVIDWRAIFFIILLSGTCPSWCCPVKPCRFRRRRRRRVIIQRGSCSISQITLLPNRRSAKAPVERFAKLIRFQYRGIFAIDKCVECAHHLCPGYTILIVCKV